MEIRIWGVRGSMPAAGAAFARYSGHTACLSAESAGALVVLDAGSGLGGLGRQAEGQRRFDILISHLHLDHLLGVPMFRPLYDPAVEVHFYGPPDLPEALGRLMAPPYWPAALADVPAQVHFHPVPPDTDFRLADGLGPEIAALAGDHPGGSLLYRLRDGDSALVHALDCELRGGMAARLTAFAEHAALLVWDAGFAPADLRPGWGHSTWEQGCAAARASGVDTVLMSHYGADYTDTFLDQQAALASREEPRCRFAKEGMRLWI